MDRYYCLGYRWEDVRSIKDASKFVCEKIEVVYLQFEKEQKLLKKYYNGVEVGTIVQEITKDLLKKKMSWFLGQG